MKKVLLINDSRFESMILADMFRQLGYEPYIADEFDALVEVETVMPHLIVVNYIMEEIRGDKLIQIIKAGQPDVTCIVSSSNQLDKDAFKASGVDGILRTPVSLFALKDLLGRLEATQMSLKDGADLSLEEGQFCPNCSEDLSEFSGQVRFCPFCGEKIA